jgi:hypothetical protein
LVVVHISSQQQIEELFTHNGVCAFQISSDGNNEGEKKQFTCGGKVVLKENCRRYKECIVYYVLK